MRILVVEDDPVLSDGLRVGLSLFGATLDTVSSCADGRAALALTEFDALVLDLGLPDGYGLDLLRELRARGDRTPVLLLGASYAFSPIGFQGITCGGGNTENCRNSTSLKYRVNVGHFRAAALWQFGGYAQNNASNGAYQFQAGGDISTWGKGVLSVDAIYSHVRDSVSLALAPGSNNANGLAIPPFLPQTLTATISDNEAAMFVAKYTNGPLKLYAGYEYFRFTAPSDPQTAFTDIAGNFLCLGCA